MIGKGRWIAAALSAASLLGCGGDRAERVDPEAVGTAAQAIDSCNEMVPANRFIDGFPAYAQCAATQNSAIYSNNGIDTATTSMGSDWVRTQGDGGYQCTELAHRYLLFKWKVTWLPRGNAGTWCDTMPTAGSGVVQTTTPVHGDLIVFAPGSCGADGTTGHVAVVDTVGNAGGKLSAVQQNVASRTSYAPSCAKCFLHVVANNGSTGTAGAGGMGAGGAAAGGSSSSGAGGTPGTGGVPPLGAGGFTPMGAGGATSSAGGAPVSSPGTGGVAPSQSTGGASSAQVPPAGTGGTVATPGTAPGGAAPTGYSGAAGALVPEANHAGSNQASLDCTVGSGFPARPSPGSVLATLGVFGLLAQRRRRALTGRSPR